MLRAACACRPHLESDQTVADRSQRRGDIRIAQNERQQDAKEVGGAPACDITPFFAKAVSVLKQSFIPGFPEGAQRIGEALSLLKQDGRVSYFVGGDNYVSHLQGDKAGERFAFACLMENGHVRVSDLQKPPLSLPQRTLMNWCAQYRKDGATSFFRSAPIHKPPVMTEVTRAPCAALLGEGIRTSVIARQLGLNDSTLRKAIARKAIPVVAGSQQHWHRLQPQLPGLTFALLPSRLQQPQSFCLQGRLGA
jgi:hypothetical protein